MEAGAFRVRAWVASVTALLVVAACGTATPAVRPSPTPAVLNAPIADLFTAASIDQPHAEPVNPSFAFVPSTPQVTAIIVVGRLSRPATLQVTWSSIDGAGVQHTLFTHQIAVTSDVVAWSVGHSPGLLALGTYRIRATLSGSSKSVDWSVIDPANATSAATSSAGPAGSALLVRQFATSRSGSDAVLEAAGSGPPQPGDTGSEPDDMENPAPDQQPSCDVSVTAQSLPFSVRANAWLGKACKPGLVMLANMQGEASQAIVHDPSDSIDTQVDPCGLPGGRSTPGSVVTISAISTKDPTVIDSDTATLMDLNFLGPYLGGHSTPAPGTRVKPGQAINLDVGTVEFPATTGIETFDVSVDGTSIVHVDHGPTPKQCDPEDWTAEDTFTYRVPASPPAVIDVHVVATDRAGRKTVADDLYPTGDQWTGTLTSSTSRFYSGGVYDNPNPCEDTWSGQFYFAVDDHDQVTGSGTINLAFESCSNKVGPNLDSITFSITGTRDATGFSLQLHYKSESPTGPEVGAMAGIGTLFAASLCDQTLPGPVFRLPLSDPQHASQTYSYSGKPLCAGSASDVVTNQAKFSAHLGT
jgi:hypothetical protein